MMRPLSGKIRSLYFLLGEETYLKLLSLKDLKKKILADGEESLNYEYLLGDDVDAAGILDAARTVSWDLFSPAGKGRRLVVVDRAEKLSPAVWKRMTDYFNAPEPDTCLVFLINRKEKDWNARSFIPKKHIVSLSPPRGKKLEEWVRNEISRHGLHARGKALEALVRLAAMNLGALAGGLETLSVYKGGGGGTVTAEEISAVIGIGREGTIFDLSGLIVMGNREDALILLNQLLDEGEKPLKIVSLLAGAFRKLWLGVEAWQKTGNPRATCEAAGVRFYQSDFLRQAQKLRPEDIGYVYRRLVETDNALKGGERNSQLALERLIIDLAGRETTAPSGNHYSERVLD